MAKESGARALFLRGTAVLLGLFLGLAALEGAMRAAGWLISASQRCSDPSPSSDKDEFRILVLGESTTAQFWSEGRDLSWPGILERSLNESGLGRNFKVFNLARPGIYSFFLALEFERNAERIRPHAVISMMGINDWVAYEYLGETGWGSLRIVKAAKWAGQALRARLRGHPSAEPSGTDTARILSLLGSSIPSSPQLASDPRLADSARNAAETLAASQGALAWYVRSLAARTFYYAACDLQRSTAPASVTGAVALHAFALAAAAAKDNPAHPGTGRLLRELPPLLPEKRDEILGLLMRGLEAGLPADPELLSVVSHLNTNDDPEVWEFLREQGMAVNRNSDRYQGTMAAYRRLADAARRRGVAYLAMQYPTGKLDTIRNMFSAAPVSPGLQFNMTLYMDFPAREPLPEYADIIFVGNENFSPLSGPPGSPRYSQYFTDNFTGPMGGRFGHTTPKGHALIAENALKAIMANWDRISRPHVQKV